MAIKNGNVANADEVMNAFGSNFNDVAQIIFNSDYLGFDSRLANSGIPNLKNVFYSIFTSDDAGEVSGFLYDTDDDLYTTISTTEAEYVIIEADDAIINRPDLDGAVLTKISSGKWVLFGSGTQPEERAKIHKALWFGTDGTDPVISDFTNVTAVKTSNSNDVDRMGFFMFHQRVNPGGFGTDTGTFTFNTSVGNDVSSWSNIFMSTGSDVQWKVNGSIKNSLSGSGTIDEIGTDTDADDTAAGSTVAMVNAAGVGETSRAWGIWISDEGGVASGSFTTFTDFTVDDLIPAMTAADTLVNEGYISGTSFLIFKDITSSSVDNAIPAINSQIDATSSEQISISADGGSNFTDVNNAEIARPVAGTALWRKIVITRTDLTKIDKVTEQAVKHNFY